LLNTSTIGDSNTDGNSPNTSNMYDVFVYLCWVLIMNQ